MHTMNTQMGRYTTSDLDKLEVPKKDPESTMETSSKP